MQAHTRTAIALGMAALAVVAGCGVDKGAAGATCHASQECATGLCYVNVCLVPARDDDEDGLDNATEHALGSNPFAKDTDNDGKPDGAEAGEDPSHPQNMDNDALADLLESAVADSDHDCLVDEVDAHNAVPESDSHVLATIGCAHFGVCATPAATIQATCKNNVLTCDYHAVAGFAVAETCDGKDNDCDGEVDEGFAYAGGGISEPCDGVGACGVGVVECHGPQADCSSNPGGSQDQAKPETCNGIDDDCDGLTDEGFVFNGLPVGSPCLGVGECGLGVVECSPNGGPRCSSNPSGSATHAKAETCNGLDDDCDGVTDNDLAWQGIALGKVCLTTGICGTGTVECATNGSAVCSSAPGNSASKAQAEICNGLDDNCNGATDEGFDFQGISLGAGCPAIGVCDAGFVVCSANGATTCSSHVTQASLEQCNGVDDDCDGETDEQLSWQGTPLGGACDGTGGCAMGVVECGKAGQVTCSTNPDGSASAAGVETCNGVDDDCDGQIDDNIATTPQLACPNLGVCAGSISSLLCAGGQWLCTFTNPAFQITEATCDNLDNDCDGLTDEELPLAWQEPTEAWTTRPVARTEIAAASGPNALIVAGGVVDSLIPGTGTVSSADVWRLNVDTLQWSLVTHNTLVARRSAGAVLLPSAGGASPQLLLVGGLDAGGAPAAPVLLDMQTGALSAPAWKNQPQHRFSPSVVWLGPAKQIWLLGGTSAGTGPSAQRLDVLGGTWSANVPQPGAAVGPIAACATPAGDLYAYGQTSLGEAFFAVLAAGAADWEQLASVPGKIGQPGRLLCDVTTDEVWLVGGVSQGDSPQPARKYTISAETWSTLQPAGIPGGTGIAQSSWPGSIAPAVATKDGKIVAALGQTTDNHGLPTTWVGIPGQWTAVDAVPEPVVGGRLVTMTGGVLRVGGAAQRVGSVVFDGAAWRHQAGIWTHWASPNVSSRAFANVVTEADGQGVLVWAGLQTPPANGDWQAALQTQPPAPGAERLDLTTGIWASLPPPQQQALPLLRPDAAISVGPVPGQWFVLGSQPATGVAQLWLVDLPKTTKTLMWQGPDPSSTPASPITPTWHPGSALSWDATWGRVLYACAGEPSSLWHYDFGLQEGWTQTAADLGLSGRLQLLGAKNESDRLLVATTLQGPVAARRLTLDVEIGVTAQPAPAMAIWGWPAASTGANSAMAWLAEPTDSAGVLRSVWLKWVHACEP